MAQFTSLNFEFLKPHDRQLVHLGASAERYFSEDPNTCLIKLRQFGELLAQLVAVEVGIQGEGSQQDLLRLLGDRKIVGGDVEMAFHELRKLGNQAVHHLMGDQRQALQSLKYAHFLGSWFYRSFGDSSYKRRAFIPPTAPVDSSATLQQELMALQTEMRKSLTKAELAAAETAIETQRRIQAEELAAQVEADRNDLETRIAELQVQLLQTTQPIQTAIDQAQKATQSMQLSEAETRALIDAQLREVGWEADSVNLTYGNGIRPIKGKNLAIAEYPMQDGRADYVLFVGLQAIGTVEAKRQHKNVQEGGLDQAIRYTKGLHGIDGEIPFAFATNSRPYLRQLESQSGIWFRDVRSSKSQRRALKGWYGPADLVSMMAQNIEVAQQQLAQEEFNYSLSLWDYQKAAIRAIETGLNTDRRELLLAMATGTGKTRTAIALVYRLLKTKRFRRILFLVDRTALGNQTEGSFNDSRMENLQKFADVFEVKGVGQIDADAKVQIATVQSFVRRILYGDPPPVGLYDCIIVDECHRGYVLDRELSETELEFRDFNDYVSKYRQVIDYFDAVKIGLTATPALHTSQIFGAPIFYYGYNQAVAEGRLVPHEPPIEIKTALSEDGITWQTGAEIETFDPVTNAIDSFLAPDEIRMEVEQFNRRVIAPEFNRVVCEYLAENLDPFGLGKTLIFCVSDIHADEVVRQLKNSFTALYGSLDDDLITKITGTAERPLEKILKFKNEQHPKIVVTVDLLTTGIDVPAICNLVFLRRVNSRILYEQMKGRATRICNDIGKESFVIYDAVGVCRMMDSVTAMTPTVVQPKISLVQLQTELIELENDAAIKLVLDQFLQRFQRKRSYFSTTQIKALEEMAGMPLSAWVPYLRQQPLELVQSWFRERPNLSAVLEERNSQPRSIYLASHEDELRGVSRYYSAKEGGNAEDYLEEFQRFLRDNQNEIAALLVVTQRPRELTRKQLQEVRSILADCGFSEKSLEVAWRSRTNEDIAASIIGFIRQAAIGDPLVAYGERVDRAMKRILMGNTWRPIQRTWLDRIGKQLKQEIIVDRSSLEMGAFQSAGGFKQLDRVFDGKLAEILAEIHSGLWDDVS